MKARGDLRVTSSSRVKTGLSRKIIIGPELGITTEFDELTQGGSLRRVRPQGISSRRPVPFLVVSCEWMPAASLADNPLGDHHEDLLEGEGFLGKGLHDDPALDEPVEQPGHILVLAFELG